VTFVTNPGIKTPTFVTDRVKWSRLRFRCQSKQVERQSKFKEKIMPTLTMGDMVMTSDPGGISSMNMGGMLMTSPLPPTTIINSSSSTVSAGISIGSSGSGNIFNGTSGNDLINGNDNSNIINAGSGNDKVNGFAGSDIINGGSGNDNLDGGLGDDIINGDSGNDIVKGGSGLDLLNGGSGNDNLDGGDGNDFLTGSSGNDSLLGGAGDDILIGVNANSISTVSSLSISSSGTPGLGEIDQLTGGAGVDQFILGDPNNVYYNDGSSLTPGTGDYALIVDFSAGQDKIQLKGSASNYGLNVVASNTQIFLDNDGIAGFTAKDELVGVVQGSTGLNLNSSAFNYV
jgi:Ca2+-binding RTX toxin-like protein